MTCEKIAILVTGKWKIEGKMFKNRYAKKNLLTILAKSQRQYLTQKVEVICYVLEKHKIETWIIKMMR